MSNSKHVKRELTDQSPELTSDELERVSGGNKQSDLVRKQAQLHQQQQRLADYT
jgi:hypothetical protein